jgi:hypothetical protein
VLYPRPRRLNGAVCAFLRGETLLAMRTLFALYSIAIAAGVLTAIVVALAEA